MNDDERTNADQPTRRRTRRRLAGAAGLLAAGALTGGVLAGSWSASAADGSATAGSSADAGSSTSGATSPSHDRARVPEPVRSDETELSGDDAARVKAAALKAVPGGTVYRVETDAGDAAYEAHMTTADGRPVTVKLDKNFTVREVQDGMGRGDPAPAGDISTGSPA